MRSRPLRIAPPPSSTAPVSQSQTCALGGVQLVIEANPVAFSVTPVTMAALSAAAETTCTSFAAAGLIALSHRLQDSEVGFSAAGVSEATIAIVRGIAMGVIMAIAILM